MLNSNSNLKIRNYKSEKFKYFKSTFNKGFSCPFLRLQFKDLKLES